MTIEISYSEGKDSTFTDMGKTHRIDDLLKLAENLPTRNFKVSDLSWIISEDSELVDFSRVATANLRYPILVVKHNGKFVVIDGMHRLLKAMSKNYPTIKGKLIDTKDLDKLPDVQATLNLEEAAEETYEVVVIGAGPGGTTAGIYLGRYLRNHLIIDGGIPRITWIPESQNFAGWPQGIHGSRLLNLMREQAAKYGSIIEKNWARRIRKATDGTFEVILKDRSVFAKKIILATGGINHTPHQIPHALFSEALQRGLICLCPICDGDNHRDQKVAVLGSSQHGASASMFLLTWNMKVTIIPSVFEEIPDQDKPVLHDRGIRWVEGPLKKIEIDSEANMLKVWYGDNMVEPEYFGCMYIELGTSPNNTLARQLGCNLADDDTVLFDPTSQMTNVDGVYVVGDIAKGLDQISTSMSQAAIATTNIHNNLRLNQVGVEQLPPYPVGTK